MWFFIKIGLLVVILQLPISLIAVILGNLFTNSLHVERIYKKFTGKSTNTTDFITFKAIYQKLGSFLLDFSVGSTIIFGFQLVIFLLFCYFTTKKVTIVIDTKAAVIKQTIKANNVTINYLENKVAFTENNKIKFVDYNTSSKFMTDNLTVKRVDTVFFGKIVDSSYEVVDDLR